jgi:hypothetical protein
MDSAVLGLAQCGWWVRCSRFWKGVCTLEAHAFAPLEALPCVCSDDAPVREFTFLPGATVNSVQTLKATSAGGTVPTLNTLLAATAAARAAAAFKLEPTSPQQPAPSPSDAAALEMGGTAMRSCLLWNVIYHPTQAGPFIQVSYGARFSPWILPC